MGEIWCDHLSFSQLLSSEQCPYGYYLEKIIGVEKIENAFAEAGVLAHGLLAGWAKGSIPIYDLAACWVREYPKTVKAAFPQFLASKGYEQKLFNSVLAYFEKFEGFPGYEVVAAEQEFKSSIAGEPFIGVIDLILRNKETGELMIVDHKSSSLSSFRKNRTKMYHQLYLYSIFTADEFGEFPKTLGFNLFRENLLDVQPFDRESYVTSRLWAESLINEMKEKDVLDWLETRPEYFRCVNLCGCRNQCAFGNPENHKRKDDILGNKSTSVVA